MTWKKKELGDICEILDKFRKPITKKNRVSGEFPYYGATGIVDWVDSYLFDETLVLVGEDGAKWAAGEKSAFLIEGKSWVNNHAHVLRPKLDQVLHKWLIYYINLIDLNPWVTGLTVPKLNQAQLRSITIPLPPIEEQQRIVAKLDAAFKEIDRAINSSKKQLIEINNFLYKRIRNLMIDLGKEYGLSSLNDISTIQPKKKIVLERLNPNDEVSFLNMNSLGIEKKYSESFTNKKLQEVYSSYQYFENNDVIFAKITPCFENGKLSIVRNLKNETGFGSSEFVILRPNGLIDTEFLYYALLDNNFREEGKKQMSGAVGHKRVTKDFFYNYKIPTPPIEIQAKMVNLLDNVFDNSKSFYLTKCKKNNELDKLKFSILYQEMQNCRK